MGCRRRRAARNSRARRRLELLLKTARSRVATTTITIVDPRDHKSFDPPPQQRACGHDWRRPQRRDARRRKQSGRRALVVVTATLMLVASTTRGVLSDARASSPCVAASCELRVRRPSRSPPRAPARINIATSRPRLVAVARLPVVLTPPAAAARSALATAVATVLQTHDNN